MNNNFGCKPVNMPSKHVWMVWVEVTYYGKYNYYALIYCIRHFVRGEFIQNYFIIFNFLLIWDKNLGSHTGWLVAKPLWICPWGFKLSISRSQNAIYFSIITIPRRSHFIIFAIQNFVENTKKHTWIPFMLLESCF